MDYLPTKKFVLILLLLLIIGGGAFLLFKKWDQVREKNPFLKNQESNLAMIKGAQIDSDNDGLKNWEEILWRTNPDNPDTDSDGLFDGEEVRLNKNPLKPGPNDSLSDVKKDLGENATTLQNPPENLSQTESLARSLLSSYFLLKQEGNWNEETQQKLVDAALKTITQDDFKNEYSLANIKIIKDNSTQNLKNYGNEIVETMNRDSINITENELTVLNRITTKKEPVEEFDVFIDSYNKIINDLLKLAAPSDIAELHLNLINNFFKIRTSVEKMKQINNDPLAGYAGLNLYTTAAKEIYSTKRAIADFFKNRGIVFTENEPGNFFNN
ncbi:MAG: hypothetical protein AB1643_01000 [Patescibacteria group bacterium]